MKHLRKAVRYSGYTLVVVLASIAHAQVQSDSLGGTAASTAASGPTFANLVNNSVVPFFNGAVIPLLYALAFLVMIFGLVRYFFTGGEENREKGKQFLVWGILGLVVIFSLWGIVNLLLSIIPK